MGSISIVFKPIIFKIYGMPMIILCSVILLLIGITIYLVRKELSND